MYVQEVWIFKTCIRLFRWIHLRILISLCIGLEGLRGWERLVMLICCSISMKILLFIICNRSIFCCKRLLIYNRITTSWFRVFISLLNRIESMLNFLKKLLFLLSDLIRSMKYYLFLIIFLLFFINSIF